MKKYFFIFVIFSQNYLMAGLVSTEKLGDEKLIQNIDSIMESVDQACLGCPPRFEYILVRPSPLFRLGGVGFSGNPFGHSAFRYTLADGTQKVFNINGVHSKKMVEFFKPEDYFYGNPNLSNQGGTYNRDMVSIRTNEVSYEQIEKMHLAFMQIERMGQSGRAKYSFWGGSLRNRWIAYWGVKNIAYASNCAGWTSCVLSLVDVDHKTSIFPEKIFYDLLRRQDLKPQVIHWKEIEDSKRSYGMHGKAVELISLFRIIQSFYHGDMAKYSDVIVEVPKGSQVAIVKKNLCVEKPDQIANFLDREPVAALLTLPMVYMGGRLWTNLVKKYVFRR